jgi:hypothetical protein
MIGRLVWKEYREQRSVWLALALLGVVVLIGLVQSLGLSGLGSTGYPGEFLGLFAVALAFTYGLVCGAMMLAGEREGRTLAFLDSLERRRAHLWIVKVGTALLLTLAQALVLAGLAGGLGASERLGFRGGWLVLAVICGWVGVAWGLLGSALNRSVLAAAGVAVILLLGTAPVWLILGHLIAGHHPPDVPLTLVGVSITAAALAASGLIFCRPDLQRRVSSSQPVEMRRRTIPWALSRILWLTYRQGNTAVLILAALSLFLGSVIPLTSLLGWPVTTLLVGVACGIAVFAGEQAGDGRHFLGDQRLPVGRIWAVKSVWWIVMTVALAALVLLALAVRMMGQEQPRGNYETDELLRTIGLWTYATMGLAYGFGFGQFFGLLGSKNAVAIVLAVLVGAAAAGLWVPSLLWGGVAFWQVVLVPAVLLASIPPVLWAWAGGRLQTWRPLLVLAGGGVLAAAWIVGNLYYRAYGIPDVGEPFDVPAFLAGLPTPEQNEAGRLIRRAAEEATEYEKVVTKELGPPAKPQAYPEDPRAPEPANGYSGQMYDIISKGWPKDRPDLNRWLNRPANGYSGQMYDIISKGWPKDRPDLNRWLNRMIEGQWAADFRKAARLPLGMVENLRTAQTFARLDYVQESRDAATLFLARARRMQHQGNVRAALDQLDVVLGLSRQLRHLAPSVPYLLGLQMQHNALSVLESGIRASSPNPDLLRSAITALNLQEAELPPFTDYLKADYVILLNSRKDRLQFIQQDLGFRSPEKELLALAGMAPWEEQRDTRLLHVMAESAFHAVERPLSEAANGAPELPPGLSSSLYYSTLSVRGIDKMRLAEARSLCDLRATRLVLALALYEMENRKPATTLAALVPKYLPTLPLDPFSGLPFHYRVSQGERIEKVGDNPDEATFWDVASGQGVVWSVGADRADDGGVRDGRLMLGDWTRGVPGMDRVYLVPRWERP